MTLSPADRRILADIRARSREAAKIRRRVRRIHARLLKLAQVTS